MPSNAGVNRWQKHESRAVRPFRSATEFLASVGARLFDEDDFTTADSIRLESVDKTKLRPAVRIPSLPADFETRVDVPTDLMRLVVTLEDRFFKRAVVVHSQPIPVGDEPFRTIELDEDVVHGFSWAGAMAMHVAVVLSVDRPGLVGVAHRAGSWVAKKTISIGRPADIASFPIEPTPPEYFESRGLPKDTTYLIELSDQDFDQPLDQLPMIMKIRLAEPLHTALARNEESVSAKALVRTLYVDIVTTVLMEGYRELAGAPSPNSILEVVTERIARSSGISADKVARLARDRSGSFVRAIVQSEGELTRAYLAAAQRRLT